MTSEKTIERSIDTLQRVYAIIIALAVNEGIKRTFLKGGAGELELTKAHIPEFIAFIFTSVPFVHGMNRHLDNTLTLIRKKEKRKWFGVLIMDFSVFMFESCLIFLLAASVISGIFFFKLLMVLLLVDLVWTIVIWSVTKTVVWQWALVNGVTVVLGCLLIYFRWLEPPVINYVLMAIAILRTIGDYLLSWDFYFPEESQELE